MKQLKQNMFWVGMAVAAAVLAAAYAVLVFPMTADAAKSRMDISLRFRSLDRSPPGKPDIANWRAYQDHLKKAYADICRHYEECDEYLERWFPGLPPEPDRGTFMGRYSDEIRKIEEALDKKPGGGVKLGPESEAGTTETSRPTAAKGGFNWEVPSTDDWDKIQQASADPKTEVRNVLKALQKRFWIRQRVAEVALNPDIKVNRVLDFRFLRRLHDKLQNPEWESPLLGSPIPTFQAQPAGAGNNEYALPDGLGRTITFRFGLHIPFSQVPRFIQEFLNPPARANAKERLLLSVTQCSIVTSGQNPAEVLITYEEGNNEMKLQRENEAMKGVGAKDMTLVMTCQVIDFDPAKAKKFDGPQSQPNQ